LSDQGRSEVLHGVRIKGIATPEALSVALGAGEAEVLAALQELERRDLVLQRRSRKRPGWVLTEAGRAAHAEWLANAHDAVTLAGLEGSYQGFLGVNAEVKALSARWQSESRDAARIALVDEVEALHERAIPALSASAQAVPRFGRYRDRLATALERLDEDPEYFVSPRVDSYHTVWFECHEDYLLTLGRTRAEEGSE